jgi:hypothetical protein
MAPRLSLISSITILALAATAAASPQTWTESLVGVSNIASPGGITSLDIVSGNGPLTTATATQSFTGLDGSGATQTMTFSGVTKNSAEFGRLHSYTEGHLTNSYYNVSNPVYANGGGGVANPDGSPDSLTSLGFAGFDDTLQFGGSLSAGYKARYVFHVDGTNSGIGYLADLAVKIGNDPDESFFAFDPGFNVANWATTSHDVDGINPTDIHVQFSNQIVFNTFELSDGASADGISDFSATLTLAGIVMYDASGNVVRTSDWTVTSASGTVYNKLNAVPEPAGLASLAIGTLALLSRKRRAK